MGLTMQFVQPQTFDEALAKLGERSPVAALLSSADWANVPVAIRERSFFSANVESVRFLDRAFGSISDFMASARDPDTGALKTGSRASFVEQMQKFAIAEGMGPLKPADKGTIKDITSEGRLKLIFDVQTKAADDYGNWKQGMDPVVLDEFPAQRFIRVRRVRRPRPYHQAALGEVRLKTDLSFWIGLNRDFGVPWGPWGYNSGCDVADEDRAAAEKLGLLKPGEKIKPVDRDFNKGLAASVRGMSEAAVNQLRSVFGSQIVITGDEIRWQGSSEPVSRKAPEVAAALDKVGLANGELATGDTMRALLDEMREVNPVRAVDKAASFDDSVLPAPTSRAFARYTELTESKVMEHAQSMFDLLPRETVETLPSIDWKLDADPKNGGSYNPTTKVLTLSTASLAGKAADEVRRVVWHELAHWMYFHGDPSYQQAIADLFRARTTLPNGKMEKVTQLPGYRTGTVGQLDDWYEAYAGRRYGRPLEASNANFGAGLEVPTRYVELLTKSPDLLAFYWNDPSQRAILMVVLQMFFTR